MTNLPKIAAARIGGGGSFLACGWILIVLGLFPAVVAMGGVPSAAAAASALISLGALLVAIGFWVRLFGKIERRLIDIEGVLRSQVPVPDQAPAKPVDVEAFVG